MNRLPLVLRLLCLLALAGEALGHEVRPAYLSLSEKQSGEVQVLWKVPVRGSLPLNLQPQLPA